MNILVCVKQVPDILSGGSAFELFSRYDAGRILNPFDRYALEAAARIRDKHPSTTITALSMGPLGAKNMLRECLCASADRAYLVSDERFAGSDSMVTARILSHAIRRLEVHGEKFDAVFCGRQAIDGDTGQVGPALAEYLHIPQVTCAVEAEEEGNGFRVTRETEEGQAILKVPMPCLLSFSKPRWEPRYPTVSRIAAAKKADIPVLDAQSFLKPDQECTGLSNSPTQVVLTFQSPRRKRGVMVGEESVSVETLIRLLCEADIF